jgi:hypothetical protein
MSGLTRRLATRTFAMAHVLTGTLTGTPTTISEQPKTETDVKLPGKPHEGR